MIVQVEDFGEAGSGGQLFVPGAVGALRTEQVFDTLVYALAGGVAASQQAQHGPGGLRGSGFGRRENAVVITGAAFAPAAIGVLNRSKPFAGAQDMDFAIILAGRAQPAQREAGSVNIGHAPAAVPASIRLLGAHQVVDAAAYGRMRAAETIRA